MYCFHREMDTKEIKSYNKFKGNKLINSGGKLYFPSLNYHKSVVFISYVLISANRSFKLIKFIH